jgi:DNA-binding transcriptional regulator YhcF (GntR family)
VRELAASLGIHFHTVAEAYRVLTDEGFLLIDGRRGATILDRAQPPGSISLASCPSLPSCHFSSNKASPAKKFHRRLIAIANPPLQVQNLSTSSEAPHDAP